MVRYESYNKDLPSGFVVFESDAMVVGTKYKIKEALAFIKSKNLWIEFERDYNNTHDSNAIKIIGCSKNFWGTDRYFIGFLAKSISK